MTINALDKKNNWGIKQYGTIKINSIKNEVDGFIDEWELDTSRQKTHVTHKETQMYQLRFFSYYWNTEEDGYYKDVNSFKHPESIKELENIYSWLEKEYDGKVVRSELINMFPNSRVRQHRDRTDMLFLCRRIHIPIKTNNQTLFVVGEDSENMIEGNIYEINNSKIHSVNNMGKENRVHLIVDILENNFAKKVFNIKDIDCQDKNTIENTWNPKQRFCVFCIGKNYCIGPHIEEKDSGHFFEYIDTIKNDLAFLSSEIIIDYSKKNNIDLNDLSEAVINSLKNRSF